MNNSQEPLVLSLSKDSEPTFDEQWTGPASAKSDGSGDDAALYLELDNWEGPLDLLLDLARRQKVDLKAISILSLVDQYIAYIERAEALKLELAADYLVMAAWLAYLKSFPCVPGVPYPHQADVEVYDSDTLPYFELEGHSPMCELAPGESVEFSGTWVLDWIAKKSDPVAWIGWVTSAQAKLDGS